MLCQSIFKKKLSRPNQLCPKYPIRNPLTLKTREHIVESREKRRKQLQNILDHVKERLENHHSGKSPLKQSQVDHHEHKVRAYEHQLEELSRDLDEEVRGESSSV